MADSSWLYEIVVHAFCDAADIADWREVVKTQHVQVGERLIGLVPDFHAEPATLTLCIELGQTQVEQDARAYERMLIANMPGEDAYGGWFAVHPQSLQAVYCLRMPLESADGAALARIAQDRMHPPQELAPFLA
jgi:hypothetical protein